MIELRSDTLVFSFPEVHPKASLTISFKRTLRIPDDDKEYPLPPGLGNFPLEHVDDYEQNLPQPWIERGGVMLPIYQSEAMWISFSSRHIFEHGTSYPFVVKVGTGKINAVTGQTWSDGLIQSPQDYLVVPDQPWLDGYCVQDGVIRQFVAMPLGQGYTAEAQITGKEDTGGLQISVYPMKRKIFEKRWPRLSEKHRVEHIAYEPNEDICYCISAPDMGLAPGGRMRQKIYTDQYDFTDWETSISSRCFVHLANSETWKTITGKYPPTMPLTAREYSEYGLPWFEYYSDQAALQGSSALSNLQSISSMGKGKKQKPLPENESAEPEKIFKIIRKQTSQRVREWQP